MEKRIKSLQESVGRWKRKARGAKGNFTYVSERHEHGKHFISISVPNVPADSTIHDVQRFIRDYVLPKYYPYRYWSVYTSKKFGGWVVTLWKEDHTVNMSYVRGLDPLEGEEAYEDDEEEL
jgi:hypothetical protein